MLAGVVMRGDLQIDCFALTTTTVGGLGGMDVVKSPRAGDKMEKARIEE